MMGVCSIQMVCIKAGVCPPACRMSDASVIGFFRRGRFIPRVWSLVVSFRLDHEDATGNTSGNGCKLHEGTHSSTFTHRARKPPRDIIS